MKKILLCLLCCMMALTACQAQTGKSSQIFADDTAMRAAVRSKWWVCETDYGDGVKYYKVLFFNDNDLCLWWTYAYAADSSLESCMQYVLQLENIGGNKYNRFADFFINCKTSGGTKKTNTLRRGYYAVNYVSERNAIYKGDEALGAFLSADRFQSGEDVYRPEEKEVTRQSALRRITQQWKRLLQELSVRCPPGKTSGPTPISMRENTFF